MAIERDSLQVALGLHAAADEANFSEINSRLDSLQGRLVTQFQAVDAKFDRLEQRITNNHKELLVAVTELKTTQSLAGTKSGIITSAMLVAVFEALKAVLVR